MSQYKILLDTCSYLRLAKSIHPLLNQEFGKENYCFYITKEFQKEYDKSSRLQNKFEWVNEQEFIENRNKPIKVSKNEKRKIEKTFKFLLYEASENISKTDIWCLTYAYVLKIPIVTDDSNMLELAKEFKIETFTSLGLLKLMLSTNYITIDSIRSIVSFWDYLKDLPKDFKKEYKNLFGKNPPKISHL